MRNSAVLTAIAFFLLVLTPVPAPAWGPGQWLDGFRHVLENAGQVDEEIYAMATFEGDLILTGRFSQAGDVITEGVVQWNGVHWEALGSGLPGGDRAVVVFQGQLFVGGHRWNGSSWEDVLQTDGPVYAFCIHQDNLYAGGSFQYAGGEEVHHLLRFDGAEIIACGGGLDGPVYALASQDDLLYVGGRFDMAGPEGDQVAASNIASWNGFEWASLEAGISGDQAITHPSLPPSPVPASVCCLAVYGGDLHVGGCFTTAGDIPAAAVARWDGSAWHSLGAGLQYGGQVCDMYMECYDYPAVVCSLFAYESSLYVGGSFVGGSEGPGYFLAQWDGAVWSPIGDCLNLDEAFTYLPRIDALHIWGGRLLAGGLFWDGQRRLQHLAAWNFTTWEGLSPGFGLGLDGTVQTQFPFDGFLIASGGFKMAGGVVVNGIAAFDGQQWHPLGEGLTHDDLNRLSHAKSMVEFEGDLVVGGWFDYAGNLPAANVARWDGIAWQSMGADFAGLQVGALGVFSGSLYAGTIASGSHPGGLYQWDGSSWAERLEVTDQYGSRIDALTAWAGDLVVAGNFESAGSLEVENILLWDGSEARPLSSAGTNDGSVRSLAVLGDDLIAGGTYWYIGGQSTKYLARWNGMEWSPVGMPFTSLAATGVYDLLAVGQQLFIGGYFTGPGDLANKCVAMWDGASWHTFDGGAGSMVYSLSLFQGRLYIGGGLSWAGPVEVDNFGCWQQEGLPVYLRSLRAWREGSGAHILWEVSQEGDGSALRLWRERGAKRIPIGLPTPLDRTSGEFIDPDPGPDAVTYWLEVSEPEGTTFWLGSAPLEAMTGVNGRLSLGINWPNPFNPLTTFEFRLPGAGPVLLRIFDLRGRLVARLLDGRAPAGLGFVTWDGREDNGRPAPSGVYLVRLETPFGAKCRKITLDR